MSKKLEKKITKRKPDDTENIDDLVQIKEEILQINNNMKTNIYKIGELLVRAKNILEHGGFKTWVKDNFEFSFQQAHNFMNVYSNCLGNPEIVHTISSSILYLITSPHFPSDLREHIFENGKNMKKIKGKEFQEVYEKFKRGEIGLESQEIKKLFKQNKKNAVNRAYKKEIDDHIIKLRKLKKYILSGISKFQWPLHPETKDIEIEVDHIKHIKKLIIDIIEAAKGLKPRPVNDDTKRNKLAA